MSLIKRAAIVAALLVAVSVIGGAAIAGADGAPMPTPIAGGSLHLNALGNNMRLMTTAGTLESIGGDPTVDSASIHVKYGTVDASFALPRTGWRKILVKGVPRIYQYRGQPSDAITLVRIDMKKGALKILGHGAALQLPLGKDRPTIDVGMIVGGNDYCMAFGGQGQFVPGVLLNVRAAPAPAECGA